MIDSVRRSKIAFLCKHCDLGWSATKGILNGMAATFDVDILELGVSIDFDYQRVDAILA